MGIEIDKSKLSKIDDIDKFMRFVLKCFKNGSGFKSSMSDTKTALKYRKFQDEFRYVVDLYCVWGYLTKEEIKLNDGKRVSLHYEITRKGLDAIKWRIISPFYPGWLSENRKYIITTSIAIIAIVVSVIALIRTF